MLGKLIKHDLRALAPTLTTLEIVTLALGAVAAVCGFIGYWSNESAFLPTSLSEVIGALMAMGVVLGAIGLICLVPATGVVILHRFYANLFTDQGYLTLTLPVRPSQIVWAKTIAGGAWLLVSCIVTLACSLLLSYAVDGFAAHTSLTSTLPYWLLAEANEMPGWTSGAFPGVSLLAGSMRTFLGIIAVLMMGYAGLSLGATWARRHKVAAGIALFVAIWTVVSMLSGTIGALIGIIAYSSSLWSEAAVALMQVLAFLRDAVMVVACFAVCCICLRKHVNLS